MDSLTSTALSFLERCDQHSDLSTLLKDFSETINHFGFVYFIMSRLPSPGERLDPYVIACTWPAFFVDHYLAENYFEHDAIAAGVSQQPWPFTYAEIRRDPHRSPVDIKLAAESREMGIKDGFAVSTSDNAFIQSGVSLASNDVVNLSDVHRKLLHIVCLHAELRSVDLRDDQKRTIAQLTDVEREALRWLATGKTLSQTADKMNIDGSNAKARIESAKRKLDAATTTHAVVTALRSKQIKL